MENSPSGKLDEIDKEILRTLQSDCSLTLTEITRNIGDKLKVKGIRKKVPRTTVHFRIQRLEREGIIIGRRAVLNAKLLGKAITGFIFLSYEKKRNMRISTALSVAETLRIIPGVQEIHMIGGGEGDILMKIKTDSVDSLARVVLEKIREIEGVSATTTIVVLGTQLETTSIDI